MQITHPFAHFPSNANILTFLPLFELFRFILYYFWASCILSGEFTLSKGKKTSRKRCVYNHGDSYMFRFTCSNIQITLHLADFAEDKNVAFLKPDACLFWAPFLF